MFTVTPESLDGCDLNSQHFTLFCPHLMNPFDLHLRTRMVFGAGSINRVGELTAEKAGSGCRALVVTDPGIIAAGHHGRAVASLHAADIETQTFDGAHENPTTRDVNAGLEIATAFKPDILIGLGGGSSMDCAKGINFLYSCGGQMSDYHGVGLATADMLPMIAIPTTAGTGSELQSFALISDADTHVKMACGDKRASCSIAILDPETTLTQPPAVTALTGIDALSHAVETWVTTRRGTISRLYSRAAWELLAPNFAKVLDSPGDLAARSAMQVGAAWAGLAIENSMLGASHALANPLTATFRTPHGQAVGLVLPHVVRFNGVEVDSLYRELLRVTEHLPGMPSSSSGSEGLADFLTHQVAAAKLQTRLSDLGVSEEQLPALSAAAAGQWTAGFNPRVVDAASLLKIYQSAF